MTSSTQETRLDAFLSVDKVSRCDQVMDVLRRGPASNRTIARKLGLFPHCITGRTNELVKEGKVRMHGRERDPFSGRRVIVWEAVE